MNVTVGTFNLNNLFSRFNFQGSIETAPQSGGGITLEFDDERDFTVRTFMGKLVTGKEPRDTQAIANRILAMDVDVLAVQEVEHIGVLKRFNVDKLNGLYDHIALIEGNDRRLIDVALMSKLPLGAITSYQTATHTDEPDKRVFSRDLVGVEVMNATRSKKLFTVYNTHLKSHFVPFFEDQETGALLANTRRQQQAEMIAAIISKEERRNSMFILLGDMNDPPDSAQLQTMLTIDGQSLFNALSNPNETRAPKSEREGPGPQSTSWTYRRNPSGPTPPEYSLIDQIWLSKNLSSKFIRSHIDRRKNHGGDGSDHDPAWIELII